ncbi:MAG: translation initiation factor IF-2 N-terminal domain-containing protein, partial [Proteobacteria bacterium]|nr:translation initiation factor IF-2 N-terminal domain-containing protein [Pseudomonadota bacterium]
MRVHELARELQIETKELMPLLKELGIEAKTHSSGLLDYQVDDVRRRFRAGKAVKTGKAGKAGKDAGSAKAPESVKEVERIDETSGEKLTERRI